MMIYVLFWFYSVWDFQLDYLSLFQVWDILLCPGLLLQTLRSCDCGAGECKAGDKYVEQLEDVLRFSMPKDKCGAFFAESIQVYNLGVCV